MFLVSVPFEYIATFMYLMPKVGVVGGQFCSIAALQCLPPSSIQLLRWSFLYPFRPYGRQEWRRPVSLWYFCLIWRYRFELYKKARKCAPGTIVCRFMIRGLPRKGSMQRFNPLNAGVWRRCPLPERFFGMCFGCLLKDGVCSIALKCSKTGGDREKRQ